MHGGNIWAAARRTGRPAGEWLDFSASINPLGMPPWVRAAAHAAMDSVCHYPDPDCEELRAAAGARNGLDPSLIHFGNGAAELIHLLIAALLPPAGLVLAPTFGRYAAAMRLCGIPVTELPAWPAPPDPGALAAWLEGAPAGAIIFLCNPNNPTGRRLPAELLDVALAQDRVWVVVDEAFLDFVPGASTLLPLVASHSRLIVLRSLTKLYAFPGLRLGWLAGPAELISRLRHLQVPWSVNAPAMAAGLAAIAGPDYAADTQAGLAPVKANALETLAALTPWLNPLATDCNYFLVRLHGITGSLLQERLLPHGILIRTCNGFTRLGDGYIRLAVRPQREVRRLVQALADVRQATVL
ncbi:MAG TPA: aminotransferase class I/II-fold pyridoxal phosphate-dependent enzyme [Symbiobacteriaceae bacterium]|nr:aminotransferase class I/II-fold pyridoxal phosphate-dependent enzyme [Symbiobacteriaceae bacterium]